MRAFQVFEAPGILRPPRPGAGREVIGGRTAAAMRRGAAGGRGRRGTGSRYPRPRPRGRRVCQTWSDGREAAPRPRPRHRHAVPEPPRTATAAPSPGFSPLTPPGKSAIITHRQLT